MGVDDLLLGLTHHWARDTSVFPTEDDRLDVPTIMLFQAYTACRPAELVDGTKKRGGGDPLLDEPDSEWQDAEMLEVDTAAASLASHHDPVSDSDSDAESEDGEGMFDEDNGYDSDASNDTSYSSDNNGSDSDHKQLDTRNTNESNAAEDEEPTRKHKALCYEDIILWIVKNPKGGDRDVLAMEVSFRHHKGEDRKPKPYVFRVLCSAKVPY